MLNRQKRLNTENYKNTRRKAKKICRKRAQELKMLEGTEEANKRNEAKKCYMIARGMKASFQPRTSICTDRDNNLIGNG